MELDQFLQSDVLQLKDIGSIHKPLNIATPEVSSNNNTGNGSDAKKRKLNESGDECRGLGKFLKHAEIKTNFFFI